MQSILHAVIIEYAEIADTVISFLFLSSKTLFAMTIDWLTTIFGVLSFSQTLSIILAQEYTQLSPLPAKSETSLRYLKLEEASGKAGGGGEDCSSYSCSGGPRKPPKA